MEGDRSPFPMKQKTNAARMRRLSPAHIIPISFLLAILAGTCLLALPAASADGVSAGALTALFTATTSVCVTGLVVVETLGQWSLFGQAVILVLIQAGGLGIITSAAMLIHLLRRRYSLRERKLLLNAMNVDERTGIGVLLTRACKVTFVTEAVGAVLYCTVWVPEYGAAQGIWKSVFTAVSAFCNAGLDLFGADSLAGYRSNVLILAVTMGLIVFGGLGFVVWSDILDAVRGGIRNRFSPAGILRRTSGHTRLVLILTAGLIAAGALLILLLEWRDPATLGGMSAGEKVLNGLFQSVTFRTAGFSTFPQEGLSGASCLVGCLLMFIGGSPIGTAGGVKTVTLFLVVMNAVSFVQERKEAILMKRKIPEEVLRKAAAIVFVHLLTVFVFTCLLLAVSPVSLEDGLFEVVSATATVGLSRGITPLLDSGGRIILICAMYLGRIAPVSLALFFARPRPGRNDIRFAEGRFYVG